MNSSAAFQSKLETHGNVTAHAIGIGLFQQAGLYFDEVAQVSEAAISGGVKDVFALRRAQQVL